MSVGPWRFVVSRKVKWRSMGYGRIENVCMWDGCREAEFESRGRNAAMQAEAARAHDRVHQLTEEFANIA